MVALATLLNTTASLVVLPQQPEDLVKLLAVKQFGPPPDYPANAPRTGGGVDRSPEFIRELMEYAEERAKEFLEITLCRSRRHEIKAV
jgi:hypothetical protein